MSLTYSREGVPDADPYRGTAFPWWATCGMTLSVIGSTTAVLLHALIWNALHPNMHGLPDVPLSHGPPSSLLLQYRDSALFQWLRTNHEGHHRIEGAQGNYNVCCPLVDVLAGTYVGTIPAAEEATPAEVTA